MFYGEAFVAGGRYAETLAIMLTSFGTAPERLDREVQSLLHLTALLLKPHSGGRWCSQPANVWFDSHLGQVEAMQGDPLQCPAGCCSTFLLGHQ